MYKLHPNLTNNSGKMSQENLKLKAQQDLEKVKKLPPVPLGYCPEVCELFDQHGLLLSYSFLGRISCLRDEDYQVEYLAIYVDGQLIYFQDGDRLLLDRGFDNLIIDFGQDDDDDDETNSFVLPSFLAESNSANSSDFTPPDDDELDEDFLDFLS